MRALCFIPRGIRVLRIQWDDFKNFSNYNRVPIHYFDHSDDYSLFTQCGELVFNCVLSKSPSDTTELDDFEVNYKPFCNVYSPPIVTPTVPKNEFQLNPQGLHARRFIKEDYLGAMTLSNKDNLTYNFTRTTSVNIQHEDCLWYFDNQGYFQRVYIDSFTGDTVTLESELPEGTYNLSHKIVINYQLDPSIELQQLWGIMADLIGDVGRYDWDVLEILNPETLEEIKRYDEIWTGHLNKLVRIMTPDGSPGPLPPLLMRIDHYHADDNFVGNVFRGDYITTLKD